MVSCAECGYWEEGPDTPGWGQCRRHAPSPKVQGQIGPVVSHGTNRAIWAYTRSLDGCGEGMAVPKSARKVEKVDQTTNPPDTYPVSRTFNDIVSKARGKING